MMTPEEQIKDLTERLADAAYARKKIMKKCADIVREFYPKVADLCAHLESALVKAKEE